MATTKKAIAEAEQAAEIKEATAVPTTEPEAPAVTLDELEGMDMNMFDAEETESAPRPAWRITDDGCADWACRKIAEEKTELDRITALGESQIEKAARALIDAARTEADEKLSAELSRLEALKAVNPNIRDDELAAIESNRQQIMESLNQAGWRLDALRLIVVTHQ